MNLLNKLIAVGSLVIASAPFALATPITAAINVGGSNDVMFTATQITFPAAGSTVAGQTVGGTSLSGTVNGVALVAAPVTFSTQTLQYNPGFLGSVGYLVASLGNTLGSGLSFFVTSETPTYTSDATFGDSLNLKGTGYFTQSGYDQTPGVFNLNASYLPGQTLGTLTSFQATSASTVAPTPEPSSLILLGSGLVSAAGMMLRRRRISNVA